MSKSSLVLGIIAVVLGILPFLSGWFIILAWLGYIVAAVGLVLGIVALAKKQDKALVGTIVNVVAFVLIYFAGVKVAKDVQSAAQSVLATPAIEEAVNSVSEELTKSLDEDATTAEEAPATEEAPAAEAE